MLPIVNAPLRLYYAYNPLRLFKDLPGAGRTEHLRAGQFAMLQELLPELRRRALQLPQALQYYGSDYILREPRKTFRLTVSTTF